MSNFDDSINSLSNDYITFINTFIELEDKAPFDNTLLNTIKTEITSYIDSNKKMLNLLDKNLETNKNVFNSQLNIYNNQKKDLIKISQNEEKEIEDKYNKSQKDISSQITRITDENQRKKEAHELDIEYFIMANNQNIDMFDLEHSENISRYNYQIENANITYQNSIARNNNHLTQKLEKLKNDYDYSLIDYDVETNKIIKKYEDSISRDNDVLEKLISDFSNIQQEHRDKKYNESVELNEKIRKLVNERNKSNVDERTKYSENLSNNQAEKDNNRNEYQLESQSISREFFLNMNNLDESLTKTKTDYNNNISDEKKDLQYRLLDLHKDQENAIYSIYSSSINEKNKKKQIRQKNRIYYDSSNLEIAQSDKTLKNLTKNFLIENEKTIYEKKLLELNRSHSIKTINEKELHDNKYYQELNNLDENDLNYKIQLLTNDYNKAANLIRLESTINTINLDKEFEKLETLHHIELEKQITDVKKTKIDLNSVKTIHRIIHEIEDKKYTKTKNYLVVHNLLEIEKDRVLNEYNNKLYNLNVKKENELLNYSKLNIKLKNHKYKQLKNAEIAIESSILQNDVHILKYTGILEEHQKRLEIEKLYLNNQYEIDKLSSSILNKRFINELKTFNQITSTYINLILDLFNNSLKILDIIFDNIIFRPEYYDIVKSFITRLSKVSYDGFERISDSFIEIFKIVVNERLQFEETFKFEKSYSSINKVFNEEYKKLSTRKNELDDLLIMHQNKVNDYNSLIFTIQNQIIYIKDPKNYVLYDKQAAKKNLTTLTNKINSITEEANENIQKMEPLKQEMALIDSKIKQLTSDYENKKAEIQHKQYYSALAYHNLITNVVSTINNQKRIITQLIGNQKENKYTSVNYETVLNKKKNDINTLLSNFIRTIYDNLNAFFINEKNEESNQMVSLNSNFEDKNIKLNIEYQETIENERNKSNKTRQRLNNNIKKKHMDYNKLEKKCDGLIKKNNNNHATNSKNIINKTSEATQIFYDEFYAICDNQKSIIDDYENTMKELTDTYHNDVNNLVNQAIQDKNKLDLDLKNYIHNHKIIINNIPEKAKNEKMANQLETKKHNQDIDKNTQQTKIDYAEKRKALNNNIYEINMTYEKNILNLNSNHKSQLRKEKKIHLTQLRHIK